MDRTFQYAQVMSNFESAYNTKPDYQPFSTTYVPLSSSSIFSSFSNQPTSPLFHRCTSPPARRPIISTESTPKFNFDLYKMDKPVDEYDDYIPTSSSIYRALSPISSRTIYHYPIHSPVSSPMEESSSLSKLRQINSELSRTLAHSDYPDPLTSSTTPHYHIHHYPLSQYSPAKHRSASISDDGASSIEVPVPSNIRKARVTYKIHVPRRPHHKSTSNVDPTNDQIVVDLYPKREEAFVKQRRKSSDDRNPWIVKGKSIQYDSYSETSTTETPRDIYYGDKLISSSRRSTHRPSSAKHHERIWYPPRQSTSQRSPKSNKYSARAESESEPISNRKPSSDRVKVRTNDPKIKRRIADTESVVKSTWAPTVKSVTRPTERESKSSIPVREPTNDTTPKPNIKSVPSEPTAPIKPSREATSQNETIDDDGDNNKQNQSERSDPSRKQKQSPLPSPIHPPPSNSSTIREVKGLPSSSASSENEPTPRSQLPTTPSTELPKPSVPEPDQGNKSIIKDDVLVHGDNTNANHNQTSSTDRDQSNAPKPQPTPPKSSQNNDQKPPTPTRVKNEDEDNEDGDNMDENDQEVAQSFDIQKWLNDASKAIISPSKKNDIAVPSSSPQPSPERPKSKSPPRRKLQPPSPPPDENLYKPPFGPKRTEQAKPRSPTPSPTPLDDSDNDAASDFFS